MLRRNCRNSFADEKIGDGTLENVTIAYSAVSEIWNLISSAIAVEALTTAWILIRLSTLLNCCWLDVAANVCENLP